MVKANRINDETLDAVTGKLHNILCYGGPDNLNQIPVKSLQKEPLCALHRYSFDRGDHRGKNRAQYMWCNDYNVILCLFCFEHFHMVKIQDN